MKLKKIIRKEILDALREEYGGPDMSGGREPDPKQKWGSDQYIFKLIDRSGFDRTEKFLRNSSKNRRLYARFKKHRDVFKKYGEKNGKVSEAGGNVYQPQALKKQIMNSEDDLRALADRRPTERIQWLMQNYKLNKNQASDMHRRLLGYIMKAQAKIPVEQITEDGGFKVGDIVDAPNPDRNAATDYEPAKIIRIQGGKAIVRYSDKSSYQWRLNDLEIYESLQEGYANSDDEMVWDYKSKKDFPKEVSDLLTRYGKDEAGAVRILSPHGKGTGLKSNKPKDGIWAYVWRMARFHSGDDPKMPVTAWWDLEKGIKEQTGWDVSFTITTTATKRQLKKLDDLVDKVLPKLGKDPYSGARAWRGLVG